jgi:rod shape-determining protein MreC
MDTILGRYRNLIVLAAILFAQIIGLAIQVRRPAQDGEVRLIRLWAIGAVTPFEKAVVHTQQWAHNKWNGYVYLRDVRRENDQLRADLEQMKLQQTRLSEDANMARRIQTLLAFKEQYIDSTVAAQVIGTSGSEQSRVLYIDKGSDDGIKVDMAVITPTGIVGKIVQVSPIWAQVLPINDQLSGVGAALKDSRLQGILKGDANGTTTLQYIMSDEPVKPGEPVITSGGDRIFPKGLPVGTVTSVEPGKDLFLNIRVIPSARLDRLEEVLVVTKIVEKLPDRKDLGPIRASDILSQRLPGVPAPPAAAAAGTASGGANTSNAGSSPGVAAQSGAVKPQGSTAQTGRPNSGASKTLTPSVGTTPKSSPSATVEPGTGAVSAGTNATPHEGTVAKPPVAKPPVVVQPNATTTNPPATPNPTENPPQ